MIPIHFDMETSDPDDVMTLALLATHPLAHLVGCTLTPGGADQVDLVHLVLNMLGRADVLVGSADPHRTKPAVSEFHYRWLGQPPKQQGPIRTADEVMTVVLQRWPDAVLLTGAPLRNPGRYLNVPGRPFFQTWVGQGGFAGDSVVPKEHRLPKFEGKETCPTFNLNGDVPAARNMLKDPRITSRTLISKNVCHGVAWDRTFHDRVLGLSRRSDGLELVLQGMDAYLVKNPQGKLLHDPLAMTVALHPQVCSLTHVEVYREKGEWGSRCGTQQENAWISTAVDHERFFRVLTS